MIYCVPLNRLRIIQSKANIYRTFSVLCNGQQNKFNNYQDSENRILYNKIKPHYLFDKRFISLESVVKWQTETYSSISNSYIVKLMEEGLLNFHDVTGFKWWATIVLSTIVIRAFVTLPLTIYQNYILAKVENISLELKSLVDELKKETAIAKKIYNLNDKQTVLLYKRSLKKQWNKLIVRDNCHPFKASLVIWFQIPIWICISFALRNLVYTEPNTAVELVTFMEMSVGGISWFPNLTKPDYSLILPVAFGLINLSIIEVQRMSKLRQPSKLYNIFTNGFRVFSVVMIPVAASVPSCLCLYWVTSSSFGLVQQLILLSPSLRRKLRIPEAPSELEHPYNHMKEETPIIASIYTSGRDEQNFSKANMFLPHRWDRNDPRQENFIKHVPSATLPFALGARSCIGKKIAMVQLTEVISQIINNFDFKFNNGKDVEPITSQVLIPNKHLELFITIRHS